MQFLSHGPSLPWNTFIAVDLWWMYLCSYHANLIIEGSNRALLFRSAALRAELSYPALFTIRLCALLTSLAVVTRTAFT